MLKSFRPASGFTLIELMTGITILAILLALGLPSYRTGLQNAQIRTAADSILNGLQVAKGEAVRRNHVVRFELNTAAGWSWTAGCFPEVADTAEDTDALPDCPANIQQRVAGEGTTNVVVAVTPNANPARVDFNGVGRTSLAAGTVLEINLSNPTGGTCAATGGEMRCLRINVAAGGQLRMCDPALTTTAPTDARAC